MRWCEMNIECPASIGFYSLHCTCSMCSCIPCSGRDFLCGARATITCSAHVAQMHCGKCLVTRNEFEIRLTTSGRDYRMTSQWRVLR